MKKVIAKKKKKPKTTAHKAKKKASIKKIIKKPETKKTEKKIEKKIVKKIVKKPEIKKITKKTAKKTADKKIIKIADQIADKLKIFDVKAIEKKSATPKRLTFTTDLFTYQELRNTKEEMTLTKYDIGAHTTSVEYAYDPMKTEEPSPIYHIDRVVILPIDPKFAFMYWEVKEDTLNHFFQMHGYDSKLTLRVYDVTNIEFDGYNAHEWWDVEIYNRVGTWYLKHYKSDRSLIVDIGVVSIDKNFHVMARSKSIYFPRDHMVAPGKILWMLVDEFGNKVISEIEDYTDEDLRLLRKILGEDRFKLFMKGGLDVFLGGSLWGRLPVIENFIDLAKIPSSGKLLSSPGSSWPTSPGGKRG
ncbi:MAG: DUF4912 domain-containing protein [Proteobacteria bacterium]|nr:DUF4912 domain-containing protein [Pseudomonadota bacterium]